MEMRKLGKTNLEVSRLALGGLFLSKLGDTPEIAKSTVKRAIRNGINFIDTAPSYLDSEEVLGGILPHIKTPLVISTKFSGDPKPFYPQNRDCLWQAVENTLKRLNRDYIDIWMVHEPDRPGQYDWWETPADLNKPEKYYGVVMGVLDDMKTQGIISYTGLGGTTAYEIVPVIETGFFDVLLTAFNYSLLWREAAIEVLPAAKKMGMGIIAGSPLQQGALSHRYDDLVSAKPAWLSKPRQQQYMALYALCDELDMKVADLAMRFVFSNDDYDCILTGSRSPEEIDMNVQSFNDGRLPADIMDTLDEIYKMVPFRPFEEPFSLPFGHAYKGPGNP